MSHFSQIKICCPPAYVTASGTPVQAPRFPQSGGAPRPVEDRSPLCPRWRRGGGCRLDEDIKISELDPANGLVYSKVMFDFMVTACLDTCGWAGDKVVFSMKQFHYMVRTTGRAVWTSTRAARPGRGAGCVSWLPSSWPTPAGRAAASAASSRPSARRSRWWAGRPTLTSPVITSTAGSSNYSGTRRHIILNLTNNFLARFCHHYGKEFSTSCAL